MSDTTVIEKTADLQGKAVELIDQLTAGLKGVAPQMADVTLAAIRFQGVMDLVFTLVMGGIALIALALARSAIRRNAGHWGEFFGDIGSAAVNLNGAVSGIGIAVGIIFSVICTVNALSPSMWAAIIDPRLALALRVIDKLM